MTTNTRSRSRKIRTRLNHPIIDSDGHQVEFVVPLEDYVKAIGGGTYVVRFIPALRRAPELELVLEVSRDTRAPSTVYAGGMPVRTGW